MYESERLARQLFSRSKRGQQAQSLSALHPDAEIAPSYDPASSLSRADFVAHFHDHDIDAARVVDAVGHEYTPLDDERIIVEGRVRVRRPGGGFTDREAVWGIVFRDGLLYRSWAVDSVLEAETRLAAYAVTEPAVDR